MLRGLILLHDRVGRLQQLRAIGPNEFCHLHIDSGAISAKKLLTAFGIRPPDFLEGRPDEAYLGLLTLAMTRELTKRAKTVPIMNRYGRGRIGSC